MSTPDLRFITTSDELAAATDTSNIIRLDLIEQFVVERRWPVTATPPPKAPLNDRPYVLRAVLRDRARVSLDVVESLQAGTRALVSILDAVAGVDAEYTRHGEAEG